MDCARVMRGMASMAKEVTPASASALEVSPAVSGWRKPISTVPLSMRPISSALGGATLATTSPSEAVRRTRSRPPLRRRCQGDEPPPRHLSPPPARCRWERDAWLLPGRGPPCVRPRRLPWEPRPSCESEAGQGSGGRAGRDLNSAHGPQRARGTPSRTRPSDRGACARPKPGAARWCSWPERPGWARRACSRRRRPRRAGWCSEGREPGRGCAVRAGRRRPALAPARRARRAGRLRRSAPAPGAPPPRARPGGCFGGSATLLEAIRCALAHLAEQEHLLVVLDDLQWSDEATLELLPALAEPAG